AVGQVGWFVLAGLLVCFAMARALNAVELGDEAATSLGLSPGRTKVLAAAGATVLCAASVAAAGPIGFVGLATPHVVRSFTGADHRWLLPYCAVLGPVLVIASVVMGRVIARPGELMVGAVTAFVGAPFLIAAVRRGRVGLWGRRRRDVGRPVRRRREPAESPRRRRGLADSPRRRRAPGTSVRRRRTPGRWPRERGADDGRKAGG